MRVQTTSPGFLPMDDTIKYLLISETGDSIRFQIDVCMLFNIEYLKRKLSICINGEGEDIFLLYDFYWKNESEDDVIIYSAENIPAVVECQIIQMNQNTVVIRIEKKTIGNQELHNTGLINEIGVKLMGHHSATRPTLVNHNHGTVCIEGEEIKEICCECGEELNLFEFKNENEVKNVRKGTVIECERMIDSKTRYFLPDDITITNEVFGGDKRTFLHVSSYWNFEQIVRRILMEEIMDVDIRNGAGITPLMRACEKKHVGILRVLLDHGAAVHTRNIWNRTVLHCAIRSGSTDIIKLILEQGADMRAKDWRGGTILHEAANESTAVLEYVLSLQQWDLEDADVDGNTPLVRAMRWGDSLETVQLLIKHGSKVLYSDERVWSPLHVVFDSTLKDDVRDFIFLKECKEKGYSKFELLEWMFCPPFSDATDVLQRNWIFRTFKECGEHPYYEDIMEVLLKMGDNVPFSTIGPFGIHLDDVIYQSVKDKDIYRKRKEDIDQLLARLQNKSCRNVNAEGGNKNVNGYFKELINSLECEKNDMWMIWKIMEEIFFSLTMDWLKPVVGISYQYSYRIESPYVTSLLSPQVQLAMNPDNDYKEILEMREEDGQSLLHVSAETGNEMAVHLFLLLGAKNVQNVKKRLPYQCAQEKGYHHLAQFIMEYYEVHGVKGVVTKNDKKLLAEGFFSDLNFRMSIQDVKLFSDTHEVKQLIPKLNNLKPEQLNGTTSKSLGKTFTLSKSEKRYLDIDANQEYVTAVKKTINERFSDAKRIYTDASCENESEKPKGKLEVGSGNKLKQSIQVNEECCGAAYYEEDSSTGIGYPIQPVIDIHRAELLALKIALEKVVCERDAVFLTDRQTIVKSLQNSVEKWWKSDGKNALLNWIILIRLKYPPNPSMKYGLQWVKAHIGIEGNEMADELANVAREKGRLVLSGEVEGAVKDRLAQKISDMDRLTEDIIRNFKIS